MQQAPDNKNRAYSAAHFALELDNNKEEVGLVRSIEGGGLKVEALSYQSGATNDIWRQPGKPKFEDIKLQVGLAGAGPFKEWLSAFISGKVVRKSGAIIAADFYYRERARRDFAEALITELSFPALSGADKNAVYVGVTIAPENIKFLKGSEAKIHVPTDVSSQKLWAACNFNFAIDGFEAATRRTTKVDGFTVRQKSIEYHDGSQVTPLKVPGRIEIPNISFTIPEADAGPLIDHAIKRTAEAESGREARNPLSGNIELFDNEGTILWRVNFRGADVISIQPDKSDASSEEFKQVKVELSVETLELFDDAKRYAGA